MIWWWECYWMVFSKERGYCWWGVCIQLLALLPCSLYCFGFFALGEVPGLTINRTWSQEPGPCYQTIGGENWQQFDARTALLNLFCIFHLKNMVKLCDTTWATNTMSFVGLSFFLIQCLCSNSNNTPIKLIWYFSSLQHDNNIYKEAGFFLFVR